MSTLTQNVYKVHYNTFHTCCMDLSSPLLLLCFLVAHLLALACLRPLASQDFTYSCGCQADSGGPVVDMNSSDDIWSIVNVERNGLHTMFILLNPLSQTASAIVYKGITKSVRLPDLTSIFRAELYALFLAIDVIRRSKLKKFVIFSDSLSSLQAIAG